MELGAGAGNSFLLHNAPYLLARLLACLLLTCLLLYNWKEYEDGVELFQERLYISFI